MWDFSNIIGQIYDLLEQNKYPWTNRGQSNESLDEVLLNTLSNDDIVEFIEEKEKIIRISKLKNDYESLRQIYLVLKDEVLEAAGFKLSASKTLNRGLRVW